MKKLLLIMSILLLVGCEERNFEVELTDQMNCVVEIYKKGNTTYHTSYGTITIKFDGKEYSLEEALEKKLVTIEDVYKKSKDRITECKPGDTKYPCSGGC